MQNLTERDWKRIKIREIRGKRALLTLHATSGYKADASDLPLPRTPVMSHNYDPVGLLARY